MATLLEEKDAIRELQARYCYYFDNAEFDRWLELWTPDGVFDLGTRGRVAGRDGLRKFLHSIPLTNGSPMMRHCVMNPLIDITGDRAHAWCYVVVIHGGSPLGLTMAGRYEDQVVKTDGRWLFQERKVSFDLMGV
ncbi:MAG TPA: nuclear transport factor 2 family protein [Candidatus Binatia bacterium]|nr:nuclear transport factor 2 family protein [Candidatus Binatia bacterium]